MEVKHTSDHIEPEIRERLREKGKRIPERETKIIELSVRAVVDLAVGADRVRVAVCDAMWRWW